jgi:hypothetical protein
VVVVSATVTLLVVERERGALLSGHENAVAPISGAPEGHRDELAPARQFSEPLSSAPVASRAPPEPEVDHAPQPTQEERKKLSPAAPPPAARAETATEQTHAVEESSAGSPGPAPAQKAGAAEADAERAQRAEAAQAAAEALTPPHAIPRSDTLLRDAPSRPSAPPGELAKREMQAAKAKQAGDEAASATAKLRAREQENAAGRRSDPSAFPAAPSAAEAVADAQSLEPKAWLERILELRRQGKLEEAEKSLKAFRERYPGYPLPPELKTLP